MSKENTSVCSVTAGDYTAKIDDFLWLYRVNATFRRYVVSVTSGDVLRACETLAESLSTSRAVSESELHRYSCMRFKQDKRDASVIKTVISKLTLLGVITQTPNPQCILNSKQIKND